MLRLSSPGGGRIRLRRCKSRAWVMTAQGHLETFGVDVRSTPESGRRPLRVKPGIARAEHNELRSTPNTRRENGHAVTSSAGHVWTAPGWQEVSSLCSIGRCDHVSGLFCAGLRFCRRIRASVSPSFRETFVARLYSFRSIGL